MDDVKDEGCLGVQVGSVILFLSVKKQFARILRMLNPDTFKDTTDEEIIKCAADYSGVGFDC